MSLPPIVPDCNYEPFISGDVSIAADAAIAPGVIIQAAPGCRIVIASGVCIGMGAILHAYNGTIEIEEEATVGAGVLVVGRAKIAAKACIGALTTVVSVDLEVEQTVAAGSILGDTSRQVSENSPPASIPTKTEGTAATPAKVEEAEATPSGTAATPTNEEEAERAKAEQSHYVSSGSRYNTFIQPRNPVGEKTGFQQAVTPTNIEGEEEEATTPSQAEADNGQDARSTEQSQFVSPGPAYHTFVQPKPISIPETNTNNGPLPPAAKTEPLESEEEEKPPIPKNKNTVAGMDYVQGMMKTLFPHKNISLAREDEED